MKLYQMSSGFIQCGEIFEYFRTMKLWWGGGKNFVSLTLVASHANIFSFSGWGFEMSITEISAFNRILFRVFTAFKIFNINIFSPKTVFSVTVWISSGCISYVLSARSDYRVILLYWGGSRNLRDGNLKSEQIKPILQYNLIGPILVLHSIFCDTAETIRLERRSPRNVSMAS